MLSNPTISPYAVEPLVVWRGDDDFERREWASMAWTIPQHSRGQVNRAGDFLKSMSAMAREHMEGGKDLNEFVERVQTEFAVIGNWRSSHSYPLQCMKMTLKNRAKEIDQNALIAQRLKRVTSIASKLERFPNMKLSQMQDIGGCRAVVSSVRRVHDLVEVYEESRKKNPTARMEFSEKYDYVADPKRDGYRGVHLVYKYRTPSLDRKMYNGLRIEIQLRSQLQHAWSTAVETVSAVTGQALKSNIGSEEWMRFFLLMSSAIAAREKSPAAPGTPQDVNDTKNELRELNNRLNIASVLNAYGTLVDSVPDMQHLNYAHYVVVLDLERKKTQVTGFGKADLAKAADELARIEKQTVDNRNIDAVLVSVDSLTALHKAYPNYFLDTTAFMRVLTEVLDEN